jgi:hypothetical protein
MKKEVFNSKAKPTQEEAKNELAAKMAMPAPSKNLLQQKILKSGLLGLNLRDLINAKSKEFEIKIQLEEDVNKQMQHYEQFIVQE